MNKIETKVLNPEVAAESEKMMVCAARLTQRGHQIRTMADFIALYEKDYKEETAEAMAALPHPTIQKFGVINVAVVGASRRFLAQITRHQNEVKFMSASLQYSDYSGAADFVVPYEIIARGEKAIKHYLGSCRESMLVYGELAGVAGNDAAGYVAPQGLRNILIISATPYQWRHMCLQRTCRRNTAETRYVMLRIWEQLYELCPAIFAGAGPFCTQAECPEGKMSCGKPIWRTRIRPADILADDFPLLMGSDNRGSYLDMKGSEYGVYRHPATSARYNYAYEGSRPSTGERFFSDGKYYKLIREDGALYLEAEGTGESTGEVLPGSPAVPVNNIGGLTASAFGELVEPGADIEDDEDFRQRIREKIAGPAENGNRQHYKTWCEEVAGVGRARIIPLWAGDNTAKGVIIGTDGTPAASGVVERVQDYIDPGGTGLGNGVANIGSRFTAVAAESLPITVSFNSVLASDATEESATEEATEAIRLHLKELALDTPETEKMVVRISTVGALLYALPSLIDYGGLTFNGEAANIEVDNTHVAVLEEVTVSAAVR